MSPIDLMEPSIDSEWHTFDCAPAAGTALCALAELPDGRAREFSFGEGRDRFRMIVLRSGEQVWGYVNRCPHFSLPLNVEPDRFVLFEHSHIYCAVHTAMFRFTDGHCEEGPCVGAALTPVPVELHGAHVRIAQS